PSARSASATLWPCGTLSASTRPEGSTVPAGRPPSLATMATLSASCMEISTGVTEDAARVEEFMVSLLGWAVQSGRGRDQPAFGEEGGQIVQHARGHGLARLFGAAGNVRQQHHVVQRQQL